MKKRAALAQLAMCLRGNLPQSPDWMAILQLANRSLVTAQLYTAIVQANNADRLPEDVRAFLDDVRTRNRERNRRLMAQLCDTLRALNGVGIEPVLLKGVAVWAGMPAAECDRILSDLDLLVRPDEVDRAIAALQEAGFGLSARYPGNDVHVVAELGRPSDVGFIDLHQRAPGPPGLAEIADLDDRCMPVTFEGSIARRPEPALQIFFLVLHDQFHDGDYWRGGFDLRHLTDIARLSVGSPAVDWTLLETLCRTRLVRTALGTQLIAAQRFAGAVVPARFTVSWWTRAQHQRHMWQCVYPNFMTALAFAGLISEWRSFLAHRAENRAGRRRLLGQASGERNPRERLKRFRRILWSPLGKV